MLRRIQLHALCLCRKRSNTRFHLMGIVREFVPGKWKKYVC